MNSLTPAQVETLLGAGSSPATIYLIGAGGCGMSGLGHLLLDLGHRVAGSDVAVNEETRQLSTRRALIHQGHRAAQILAAQPTLVIYSSAIRADNVELLAAQQQAIPTVPRAVVLAALLSRRRGVCAAGMHGKTTTAALLAFALDQLGAKPSYAIGAEVPQLFPHARLVPPRPSASLPPNSPAGGPASLPANTPSPRPSPPMGEREKGLRSAAEIPAIPQGWFVIEADESDGTLHLYQPKDAIVLNVDEEHLDHYGSIEVIVQEFHLFAAQITGTLIYCADDPRLVAMFSGRPHAYSYGYDSRANYRIQVPVAYSPSTEEKAGGRRHFDLWKDQRCLGHFAIRLLGEKNISNAAAVIAMLDQAGFDAAAIARAIEPFTGAARRQQELFRNDAYRIFDDYGHHPREISATLQALKQLGGKRLLVAFQPHRYTRTQHLLGQFANCFRAADRLWITNVYAASEDPIPGISGETLAAAVRAQGQAVDYLACVRDLPDVVRAALQPGDLILFLGAGDITQAAHQLADALRAEFASGLGVRPSGGSDIPPPKGGTPNRAPEHALNPTIGYEELASSLSPETVWRCSEPLAKHTTLRVGGQADFYVEPGSEADLAQVLQFCTARQVPFQVLGRGSNLLVRDGGIRGVVICLAHPSFSRIEVHGAHLTCGAGAKVRDAVMAARRQGLGGLEFLEGIPGSIGGALRMNAGAMGGSFFQVVDRVRYMDRQGNVTEQAGTALRIEYRHCSLFDAHIALAAVLKGEPAAREAIDAKLNTFNQHRWRTQPAAPSAGCIFKNPGPCPAGKLIDELGLKGTRVGGAVVSDRHANFIVNVGNATATDILNLIAIIRDRVRTERGIELETEVQIIGEDCSPCAATSNEA